MSFRKTLLAATVLMAPAIAQAQPVTGLYVAGGAGVNWLGSTSAPLTGIAPDFGNGATPFSFPANVSFNTGWVALASVGWGFGNGLRLEFEGNYRENNVRNYSVSANGPGFPPINTVANGTAGTFGLMVNALYDFRIGGVMPYIGGGIGYAWNRWSNVGGTASQGNSSLVFRTNDTAGSFAYQGIAGLAVPITAIPGLALTLEYRYFATLSANLGGNITSTQNFGEGTATVGAQSRIKPDNNHQSILIGARYNFGQRPAAPPPAAAPAPARSFLVFFDFARDDLTARAREIIAQAAAASRSQQVTRIEVAGHTDTVGSAQYNQGLSQRRANNVAAELVRLGVPRQSIQTAAYGFSRPLVPTGPNVREPQNRRVEIVLR